MNNLAAYLLMSSMLPQYVKNHSIEISHRYIVHDNYRNLNKFQNISKSFHS